MEAIYAKGRQYPLPQSTFFSSSMCAMKAILRFHSTLLNVSHIQGNGGVIPDSGLSERDAPDSFFLRNEERGKVMNVATHLTLAPDLVQPQHFKSC